MTDTLTRLTVRDATITGHVAGELTITGYVVYAQPADKIARGINRPVCPDEPDTKVEVGYSRDALKPLTLVYKDMEVTIGTSLYMLFRYVYDLYRAEGRTKFDFAELSEVLTGDEFALTYRATTALIYRLSECLSKLNSPISLSCSRESLCIEDSAKQWLDPALESEERNVRGNADRFLPINRRGRNRSATLAVKD